MVEVHQLPREVVGEWWPAVRPFLLAALDQADEWRMQADDFLPQAQAGQVAIWAAIAEQGVCGAAVARVTDHPGGRAQHVIALGGTDFDDWMDAMNAALLENARAHGCKAMTLTGRKGWVRKLPRLGWHDTGLVMMERPVDG